MFKNRINAVRAGVVAGVSTLAASAHAALPAGVTDALTGAQADGVAVATLVFAAIVAIYAFKLMRKGL